MSKGAGNSPGTPPSSGGLRKPTDASQLNGQAVNPPRYASRFPSPTAGAASKSE